MGLVRRILSLSYWWSGYYVRQQSEKRVSVLEAREFVNNTLLGWGVRGVLKLQKYHLSLPISESTTHACMLRLGCKWSRGTQSFYIDAHERPGVVDYC